MLILIHYYVVISMESTQIAEDDCILIFYKSSQKKQNSFQIKTYKLIDDLNEKNVQENIFQRSKFKYANPKWLIMFLSKNISIK